MRVLHHGCAYPNFCKCRSCDCEFIYDDNETISVLDCYDRLVWTYIVCPECNQYNTIYNYKGKIDKVRAYNKQFYSWNDDYDEIMFDENTMERR